MPVAWSRVPLLRGFAIGSGRRGQEMALLASLSHGRLHFNRPHPPSPVPYTNRLAFPLLFEGMCL